MNELVNIERKLTTDRWQEALFGQFGYMVRFRHPMMTKLVPVEDGKYNHVDTKEVNNCCVDFEGYKIYNEPGAAVMFTKKESCITPDPVYELSEAEIEFEGSMRFDGCLNLDWPKIRKGEAMLHFCGSEKVRKLCVVLAKVYEIGQEMLTEAGTWIW